LGILKEQVMEEMSVAEELIYSSDNNQASHSSFPLASSGQMQDLSTASQLLQNLDFYPNNQDYFAPFSYLYGSNTEFCR
jgi:hypothetical protein